MPGSVVWTRYGAPAREALRSRVAAAKRDDPLAPVTVLVPTDLAGVAARRALARGLAARRPGVAGLAVLTLDRLAELVAAPALAADGRRPLAAAVLAAAWRRELAEGAGSFAAVARHPATVRALVEAHHRLRDVPDERLDAVAATSRLTADLVGLYRRVRHRLAGRWYDAADLRAVAARLIRAEPARAARIGAVILFLPQDLDARAARFAGHLAAHGDLTVIAGGTGHRHADAGVLRSLERLGLPADPPPTEPAHAAEVLHASDSDDEVRAVVRQVCAAARTVPPHRIAVLYAADVPYRRLLFAHLAAAGITATGPAARPTAERVLPRAVVDLLALPDTGYDRAAVFRLLSDAPVRDADGSRVPTARWERISRAAGVVSRDDWDARLTRYAAEQRARAAAGGADGAERTAAAADGLRGFVARLRGRLDAGLAARDWPTLVGWAQDLIDDLFGTDEQRHLPEEERAAADRVDRLLAGLSGLATVEPEADLDALRQVIELELADDLPRTGQLGTGVLVAPLPAAVGLDCDAVFVTGLAEGLYPGPQPVDALLPEAAREATGGALPALRDHLDRRRRHLLAAFAAAPRVVASFPRGDLRHSNVRLASRWLLPTLRSLGDDPGLAAADWPAVQAVTRELPSFSSALLSTADPATEQEWRVQAAASARVLGRADPLGPDAVLGRGRELLRARASDRFTRFDGNLAAHAAELPHPTGDRIVSATQLESWVACPHAYLVRRLLGVQPVERPEELVQMSPLERGSFLHEALDRFFAWQKDTGGVPGPREPWTPAHRARLASIGRELAAEYEQRGGTGHPTLWARDLAQLLADLDRVLDQDEARRAELGTRQVRSELHFGHDRWPEPVTVPLPDGRRIRFRGSADRIDVTEAGRIIVVDYKSGSAKRYAGLSEDDPDLCGSRLQLPLYAYAARQRLGRPDAAVRAEYWFVGRREAGRRIGYEVTARVAERFAHVLGVIADGIAGGLFPHRAPEDQPWLDWVACAYCDPDGLGAKRRRDEWTRKKHAPELAGYLALVEPGPAPAPKAAP